MTSRSPGSPCRSFSRSSPLKGAELFALWTGKPHRATRDLDLLGLGDPSIEHVCEVFSKVRVHDVVDDGVHFDLATLGFLPAPPDTLSPFAARTLRPIRSTPTRNNREAFFDGLVARRLRHRRHRFSLDVMGKVRQLDKTRQRQDGAAVQAVVFITDRGLARNVL
jgi:hypothetical protein